MSPRTSEIDTTRPMVPPAIPALGEKPTSAKCQQNARAQGQQATPSPTATLPQATDAGLPLNSPRPRESKKTLHPMRFTAPGTAHADGEHWHCNHGFGAKATTAKWHAKRDDNRRYAHTLTARPRAWCNGRNGTPHNGPLWTRCDFGEWSLGQSPTFVATFNRVFCRREACPGTLSCPRAWRR